MSGARLPEAPRQAYRVRLRGRNVVAEDPVHPGHAARLGFFATCYVAASSERGAGDEAFSRIYADEELKGMVRNDPSNPPAVDVEDVEEIVALPDVPAAKAVHYEWFHEGTPVLEG